MKVAIAARQEPTAVSYAWNYWRTKIVRRASTVQVLLLSTVLLVPAGWGGAQSTQNTPTSSANAGSSSSERTEQQQTSLSAACWACRVRSDQQRVRIATRTAV